MVDLLLCSCKTVHIEECVCGGHISSAEVAKPPSDRWRKVFD